LAFTQLVHSDRVLQTLALDQDGLAASVVLQSHVHHVVQIGHLRIGDLEVAKVTLDEGAVKHLIDLVLPVRFRHEEAREGAAELIRTHHIFQLTHCVVIRAHALSGAAEQVRPIAAVSA